MTRRIAMTEQKHPDWVRKAATAVAALYGAKLVKEHMQTTEARLKTDAHQVEADIADIIHRHFQEQK
jgi:hypothetical protein